MSSLPPNLIGPILQSPLIQRQVSAVRGGADLTTVALHAVPALVAYGVAAGALSTIATGRSERRIALLGGLLGVVTGLLAVAAVWIHEAFFLAVLVFMVRHADSPPVVELIAGYTVGFGMLLAAAALQFRTPRASRAARPERA